jgi:hypothetical protein
MSRTHRERILDYLWSISPDYATNSQIREATGFVHTASNTLAGGPPACAAGSPRRALGSR